MTTARNEETNSSKSETQSNQKYQLTSDKYKVNRRKLLGEGTYGKIFCAMLLPSNEKIAVKKMDNSIGQSECKIMCLLSEHLEKDTEKSKYIIKFFGYNVIDPDLHLLLEYMDSGTLHDWIYCFSSTVSNERWKTGYKLLNNIANGLSYIHQMNVIHCDLNPKNVLLRTINDSLEAKISDFGLSYTTTNIPNIIRHRGTLLYMAPELIPGPNYTCTKESDIFSLGMTIWEMLEQKEPYEKITVDDLVSFTDYVAQHGCNQPISKDAPVKIKNLIELCFNSNPKLRPNADKIVEELKTDINTISLKA